MALVNPSASPAIPGVTTLASVSLFSDVRALAAGQYPLVWVLGGTVAGDGKDGVFYWSASSLTADDGLTVLAPNAGGTGRWIRLYSGFSLSSGASHVSTVQSGNAPTPRTVQDALRAMVRSGDFASTTNYNSAVQALTETIGVFKLEFQSAAVTDDRTFVKWTPATAGRGPFVISGSEPSFSSTRDPTFGWGYNSQTDGVPIVGGEPCLFYNIEGNYNDGSGANKMEAYLHFIGANGTTNTRPFFVQLNRTTAKVAALYLKSDTVSFIADDGTANEGGAISYTFTKSRMTVAGTDATLDTGVILSAASAKGSYISLGFNAVADKLRLICDQAAGGYIEQGGRRIISFWSTPNGGAGEAISVGVQDNSAVGVFDSVNGANSVASLIARAKSSQTSKAFQVQDSSSNPMFSTDRLGNVVSGGLAALATNATDGFLYMPSCAGTPTATPTAHTGKVAFVYDSTNNIIYLYNGGWKKTVALT